MRLAVVTCTTNRVRSYNCTHSWQVNATTDPLFCAVLNGEPEDLELGQPERVFWDRWVFKDEGGYLGSVPAFRAAVDWVLRDPTVDVIACLHDDVEILEPAWDARVIRHFERHESCGLLGFGGALGLGDDDIYQTPYRPMQLARKSFRSNLVDAEVHGIRSLVPEKVACLDGFSQVGRREFWEGISANTDRLHPPPLQELERLGMVHHAYDSALGVLAQILGWETWYLPIRCRHFGGQTAVGDAGYQAWAKAQNGVGDQGFWETAHKALYELGRGTLPLRV